MAASVTGWRRLAPGSYNRGVYAIRNTPDTHTPDRPWVLLRASVSGGWDTVGRFHTLKLAKLAAR